MTLLLGILITVGMFLVILEFLIPGFEVLGILGIILMAIGGITLYSFVKVDILIIGTIFLIAFVLSILLFNVAKKRGIVGKITLNESLYIKKDEDIRKLLVVGEIGRAKTTLKPYGIVEIGDREFDAVSNLNFIDSGKKIKVNSFKNGKVIVMEVK